LITALLKVAFASSVVYPDSSIELDPQQLGAGHAGPVGVLGNNETTNPPEPPVDRTPLVAGAAEVTITDPDGQVHRIARYGCGQGSLDSHAVHRAGGCRIADLCECRRWYRRTEKERVRCLVGELAAVG
jgi:hypothetical protein